MPRQPDRHHHARCTGRRAVTSPSSSSQFADRVRTSFFAE
jgi:hypothetical protein